MLQDELGRLLIGQGLMDSERVRTCSVESENFWVQISSVHPLTPGPGQMTAPLLVSTSFL